MKKSEKTLHFIHEATNTINTPPPSHCLRPGTGSQKTTFEGASEDERPCDQGEGENLKLLRLQNSFHYRSVSKIFQTCSIDFGSNIILIALIAILDKVWGLEDLLSMAAWFSRHTLEIPHIWWHFFFGCCQLHETLSSKTSSPIDFHIAIAQLKTCQEHNRIPPTDVMHKWCLADSTEA